MADNTPDWGYFFYINEIVDKFSTIEIKPKLYNTLYFSHKHKSLV